MYADYIYYCSEFFGNKIDEKDFPRLAMRASEYIDYLTLGKAKKYTKDDQVKKACCAIAEQYAALEMVAESVLSGEIASESVGEHSVTYRSSADTSAQAKAQCKEAASRYLAETGLLYRGIGKCTHRIP